MQYLQQQGTSASSGPQLSNALPQAYARRASGPFTVDAGGGTHTGDSSYTRQNYNFSFGPPPEPSPSPSASTPASHMGSPAPNFYFQPTWNVGAMPQSQVNNDILQQAALQVAAQNAMHPSNSSFNTYLPQQQPVSPALPLSSTQHATAIFAKPNNNGMADRRPKQQKNNAPGNLRQVMASMGPVTSSTVSSAPLSPGSHLRPNSMAQHLKRPSTVIDPATLALPLPSPPNNIPKPLLMKQPSHKKSAPTPTSASSQGKSPGSATPLPIQDLNFKKLQEDLDSYSRQQAYRHVSPDVATVVDVLQRDASPNTPSLASVASPPTTREETRHTVSFKDPSQEPRDDRSRQFSPALSLTNEFSFSESAEDLQANDPLATQMWKFFSKSKATLPHAVRMENLSWRLGGMKLGQAAATATAKKEEPKPASSQPVPANAGTSEITKARTQPTSPETLEDLEAESRGRKARSAGNTPEYSGGDHYEPMDWKAQSRSRSRVPRGVEMDWRASSRSRSRVRPRMSLPELAVDITEEAPSSALGTSVPTAASDEALYASLFGDAADSGLSSSLGNMSDSFLAHNDDYLSDWFSHTMANPSSTNSAQNRLVEPEWAKQYRSFNMDPAGSLRNNASIPGLKSEGTINANQSVDFGFLPKLIRKTSADATGNSESKKEGASEDTLHLLNGMNFVDPLALTKAITGGSSAPSMTATTTSQADKDHGATYAPLFKNQKVESPAAINDRHYPSSAVPSSFANAFSSLPPTPLLQSAQSYFNFTLNHNPAALNATSNPSSFVDPNVLLQGTSVQPSSMHIPASMMNALSPTDDLTWPYTPDHSTPLSSRPPSPGPSGATTPLDSMSQSFELNSAVSFSGGPQRSSTLSKRKTETHGRSNSVSGGSAVQTASGSSDGTQLVCSNCNTTNTPLWRRDDAGKPLCNGCGLFKKLHGIDRPLSLATGIVKKRNRSRLKDKDKPAAMKTKRKNSIPSRAST